MRKWYITLTIKFNGAKDVLSTRVELTIESPSIGEALITATHHMELLRGGGFEFSVDRVF
jgi:hypothetical protein